MTLRSDSRATSSVLSTILLTGIVAITVTASGAAVIGHSLDQSAAGHVVGQVDVSANTTAQTVEVVHLGGDDFAPDTLEAVLKSGNDSVRVPFTDGTISGGGDFVPASTWRYNYSGTLDGHLKKVYVVYTPRNDVLDVERFTNTTGTPGASGGSESGFDWGGFFDAVTVVDQTGGNGGDTDSGHAAYNVTYSAGDVDDVTVTYADVDAGTTGEKTGDLQYYKWGQAGDEFAITVSATVDGETNSTTINDVADGFDPDGNGVSTRDGEPLSNVTLVDFSGPYKGASYYIDYTADDSVATVNASFVDSDEGDWANYDTPTQSVPADGTGRLAGNNGKGGTLGDSFNITVRAFAADGTLVDQYVLTDVADGRDTRDGRTVGTRHYITNVGFDDKSNENADKTHYQVDYDLTDSTLDSVVVFHDEDTNETTKMDGKTNTKANFESEKGTYGDYYNITILAVDDGVVVDSYTLRDRSGEAPWNDGGDDGQSSTGDESPTNVEDPGFAYVDINGDWQYDKHTDEKVNNLKRGFETTAGTLVVPESVSVEATKATTLSADGIYLAGDIASSGQGDDITLNANGNSLELIGATVKTTGYSAAIELKGATITASNTTMSTDQQAADITITATDGIVDLYGANVRTGGYSAAIDIDGVSIDVSAATVETDQQKANIDISSDTGDITAEDAIVKTHGYGATVDVTGPTVSAANLTIRTDEQSADITVTATDGNLGLRYASVTTSGYGADITLAGETVDLRDATVETEGNGASVSVSGSRQTNGKTTIS